MKQLNFAILGAGSIAGTMARTIARMPHVHAYAIGSRTLEKAQAFAAEHGFEKAYGSYEELVKDPKVDLVYIATPHSHHLPCMELCLDHKKAMLCEKAFTVNAAQARKILARAEAEGVLLTEAIWPRYMPMARTLRDFAASGKIGKITHVYAELCYPVFHVQRLWDPNLAGGALLDIGVYPLTFVANLLGSKPVSIVSDAQLSDLGMDQQNTILLTYEGGVRATVHSSSIHGSPRQAVIYGTKGYGIVGNMNNYEYLEIYDKDYHLLERIDAPAQITGYEYEVDACIEALDKGWLECPQMPHAETISVMELMDRIRAQWGMVYPPEIEKV